MKQYKMKVNGFMSNIYSGEKVVILNTENGVCQVETEDGIEDFVMKEDLEVTDGA